MELLNENFEKKPLNCNELKGFLFFSGQRCSMLERFTSNCSSSKVPSLGTLTSKSPRVSAPTYIGRVKGVGHLLLFCFLVGFSAGSGLRPVFVFRRPVSGRKMRFRQGLRLCFNGWLPAAVLNASGQSWAMLLDL